MKKKVLFIINDLRMGGAQRVLSIVMRELARSGYDVALITNHTDSSDFYTVDSDIVRYSTELYSPSRNTMQAIKDNLKRISRIRQVVSKESPDAIFSFMTETNILTILATVFSDTRIIVSERSDPQKEKKSAIWKVLRNITYRNATVITSNNKSALNYLATFVNKDKLVYLPNPVEECEKIGSHGKGNESTKIILAVARLHQAKGIDILIDAISILKLKNKDFQVWIAGDGPEKENLHNQAMALAVERNIKWLGGTSELVSLYKRASIFVLPSRREGMPNALLEAMSCGLPVIISNASPGPLEYVVNGESGLVFESGSSSGLAGAIDELLVDDDKRLRMGKESMNQVKPLQCANIIPLWEKVIFQNHMAGSDSIAS